MAFSLSKLFSGVTAQATGKPNTAVGIDIGASSIKVTELELTEKALQLRTYGELQLGPYGETALGETVALEAQKQTEALVDVLRESSVKSKQGALAMPLSSSFMTVIPVNLQANEDLAKRIPVEARKYVPLPLNDVMLDWTELPSTDKKTSTKEVMLAAIETKAMANYRQLLTSVGMTGEPAEIEAFCLIRALWRKGDTSLAIIDIGARTTKLYIVRGGILERLHRVFGGGAEITRKISQQMNITFEEAENLKRADTASGPHSEMIKNATFEVVGRGIQEFKRIIDQYEARMGAPLGRVAVSGGVGASIHTLSLVNDGLNKTAEIGNPFGKVAYPAFMEDTLLGIAPNFAVSLGAALRQFQI